MQAPMITHSQPRTGSDLQSRFQIVDMKEVRGTEDMKQHVPLVNLAGSQAHPVLPTKPHTHPLLLQQSVTAVVLA